MGDDLFWLGWRKYADARHDFRHFKAMAPAAAEALRSRVPRLEALQSQLGFHVDASHPQTLQFSFGLRPMGRQTVKGVHAVEYGGDLVYSFGPKGHIATILFPRRSELGGPYEDHLYLRLKRISASRLLESLERDFRDLVAYSIVSSFDGSPTVRDRIRIGWLRFWRHTQRGGKFSPATVVRGMRELGRESSLKLAGKIIAALLFALLIAALLWIGFSGAAGWLEKPPVEGAGSKSSSGESGASGSRPSALSVPGTKVKPASG